MPSSSGLTTRWLPPRPRSSRRLHGGCLQSFSGTPARGHLLPMLPRAVAARCAGHDVPLRTSGSMAGAVSPLRVLPAGPMLDVLMAVVRLAGRTTAPPILSLRRRSSPIRA